MKARRAGAAGCSIRQERRAARRGRPHLSEVGLGDVALIDHDSVGVLGPVRDARLKRQRARLVVAHVLRQRRPRGEELVDLARLQLDGDHKYEDLSVHAEHALGGGRGRGAPPLPHGGAAAHGEGGECARSA
jgi:hypothetical protein